MVEEQIKVSFIGDGADLTKTSASAGKSLDNFNKKVESSGRSLAQVKKPTDTAAQSLKRRCYNQSSLLHVCS